MSEAAEDLRDLEEYWRELKMTHQLDKCLDDCPYCDDTFEVMWDLQ